MKTLSIIIPAYNEEKTLAEIVKRLEAVKFTGNIQKEIIIVDDASRDATPQIVASLPAHYVKIRQLINQGKGAAITEGFKRSTGDIVLVQDADLEYDPQDINLLLEPILSGDADVVYGSRFISGRPHRVLYYWHFLGNTFLTFFSNMFTNLNLSDMETCYKMFTREAVDSFKNKLVSKRFGIEPELTARVKRLRIYEVGVSYSGRTYAQGKKIGWKDGFSALWCIVKFNTWGK